MNVGLISDTHGLLRPQAVQALFGTDVILHAGDIGHDRVLEGLADLAPVHAVRGNVDRTGRASLLPDELRLELAGYRIYLVHDRARAMPPDDVDIVVFGHSHQPGVKREGHVLWINPGSAGPRRFNLPVGVGILRLGGGPPAVSLIPIEPEKAG